MSAPAGAAVERLAEAVAEFEEGQLAEDERQLGLFSTPITTAGRGKFKKQLAALDKRPPGRPPNARNKRSEVTVAHLLGRYRDPRAIALERVQMHPADLAAMLGCSLAQADERQRLWATAVFPFLHARITPEVVDNRQVIHLHFGAAGEPQGAAGAGAVHVLDPAEFERVEFEPVEASVADRPSAPNDENSEA